MKKIKSFIIVLFIIIVLIIAIKIMINKIHESKYIDGLGPEYYVKDFTPRVEKNASVFYTVEDCVQNYLDYTVINSKSTPEDKEFQFSSIYKLLDSDYINKNNITVDNISEYITTTGIPLKFFALKMEYVSYENNLQEYRVYGKTCNSDTGEFISYCYFKVTLNTAIEVYCIEPIYNCNSLQQVALDDKEIDKQIEYNLYNRYKYYNIEDNALMYCYLEYLKNALINSPEEIYNILDGDYKKENFPTLESFRTFIDNNKAIIEDIEFKSCETEDNIVNKKFTCEDYNQKKYIFNQQAIMDFSLILEY